VLGAREGGVGRRSAVIVGFGGTTVGDGAGDGVSVGAFGVGDVIAGGVFTTRCGTSANGDSACVTVTVDGSAVTVASTMMKGVAVAVISVGSGASGTTVTFAARVVAGGGDRGIMAVAGVLVANAGDAGRRGAAIVTTGGTDTVGKCIGGGGDDGAGDGAVIGDVGSAEGRGVADAGGAVAGSEAVVGSGGGGTVVGIGVDGGGADSIGADGGGVNAAAKVVAGT